MPPNRVSQIIAGKRSVHRATLRSLVRQRSSVLEPSVRLGSGRQGDRRRDPIFRRGPAFREREPLRGSHDQRGAGMRLGGNRPLRIERSRLRPHISTYSLKSIFQPSYVLCALGRLRYRGRWLATDVRYSLTIAVSVVPLSTAILRTFFTISVVNTQGNVHLVGLRATATY